jgi:hypothetical protein
MVINNTCVLINKMAELAKAFKENQSFELSPVLEVEIYKLLGNLQLKLN